MCILNTLGSLCNVLYRFQLTKSTSNLNDVVYSGRPKTEEPHVKRTTKKKSEKIEYIVRVDLVSKPKKLCCSGGAVTK